MITIIAACSKNRVIGNNGKIPWHLPKDFKMFKEITMGHDMIMGRKTFDSLPGVLPGRRHFVITRQESLIHENSNVFYVRSLEEAYELTSAHKMSREVFIVGGGEIYQQSINDASKILLTVVDTECSGDAFFPEADENVFDLVKHESNSIDEKHKHNFIFKTYIRK